MRGRKIYGQSRVDACPFCGSQALSKNGQGIPVCRDHRKMDLPDMKCLCGEWIDIREGKWGPFFSCMNCGAMSFAKGLEINEEAMTKAKEQAQKIVPQTRTVEKNGSKETTVRSDELDFL